MTWKLLRHVFVPLLVILAGAAAIVYGTKYHTVPLHQGELIEQEVEEEVTKNIPRLVPVDADENSPPLGNPGDARAAPPAEGAPEAERSAEPAAENPKAPPGFRWVIEKEKVPEIVKHQVPVTKVVEVREPELIFNATVGGVQMRSGEIWRTYGPGEPPPSLCPT